jgi:hypothetical protein
MRCPKALRQAQIEVDLLADQLLTQQSKKLPTLPAISVKNRSNMHTDRAPIVFAVASRVVAIYAWCRQLCYATRK